MGDCYIEEDKMKHAAADHVMKDALNLATINLPHGLIHGKAKCKSALQNAAIPVGSTMFACDSCTLLNKTSASSCGFDFDPPEPLVPDHEERLLVCQACKGSFVSKSSAHELLNCNHGFCKPCLRSSVEKHLLDLIHADADADDALNRFDRTMRCPVDGCGRCLSRYDLRLVVGPSMQGLLDEWLMKSLTYKVLYPLVRFCPNCKYNKKQLLIPPSQFHKLQARSLRKAFVCNGITLPPGRRTGKGDLVQDLRNAAPFSLLCSRCRFLVCQNCGSKGAPPAAGMTHQCDGLQRQCFDIGRSIMKLCSAYIRATHAADKNKGRSKRPRMCCGFFSSNKECSRHIDGKGVIYDCLVNWFSAECFLEISQVEGTAATGSGGASSEQAVDKLAETALQKLTSHIVGMQNENEGAISPVVASILCSHDLPYTLLKWLLKNDSIMDITDRGSLYQAALSLLRALSGSCDLLPLLCCRDAKHDYVEALSHCHQTPGSVMSEFKNLYTQAQFILRRCEHLLQNEGPKGKKNKQSEHIFSLPGMTADVIATYELLYKRIGVWEGKTLQHSWLASTNAESSSMTTDGHHEQQPLFVQLKALLNKPSAHSLSPGTTRRMTTRSIQASAEMECSELVDKLQLCSVEEHDVKTEADVDVTTSPSAALIEAYKRALQPLQFDEAGLLSTHYFRLNVAKRETLMLNKKRARAISEEMTLLNTSLPLEWQSSIFLRMDEQRADVLRALIIGPEGTPYENGVFLFDLLLGKGYPDMPPEVHFLTTAGGKVRFNPNLYGCGTVCLSLLGTWFGPGWTPGQSNIMQVLVSIQGLILVADPYYNEPAYVKRPGNCKVAYNYLRNQRLNTVQHSMLPALQHPDPLFLPVIHTHFRLKAPHVLSQCAAWMEEETRHHVQSQLQWSIDQLSLELDKLNDASTPLP